MTRSPGTYEATQALRAAETGLGSAGCNIPTGAAGRMAREKEARGPWSQARPSRGSLRHAHLLPCLGGSQELELASTPQAIGPQSVMMLQEKIQ